MIDVHNQKDSFVYYVYPRLLSFMNFERIKVDALADSAGISANTVSKIRSGQYVTDTMIDRCADAIRTLSKNVFDFDKEKMAAQGFYNPKDVKAFIGNKPVKEAADMLGIDKYMLEWIVAGKPVSEDFHLKYVKSRIPFFKKSY